MDDRVFRPGQRVRLERCTDLDALPPGATGVVTRWEPSARQLDVDWEPPHHGRRLMFVIAPGVDEVTILFNPTPAS